MNIGLAHLQLKATKEAPAALDKAVTLATTHTNLQIAATSQTRLANFFRDSGDFPAAESAVHRALQYDLGLQVRRSVRR